MLCQEVSCHLSTLLGDAGPGSDLSFVSHQIRSNRQSIKPTDVEKYCVRPPVESYWDNIYCRTRFWLLVS